VPCRWADAAAATTAAEVGGIKFLFLPLQRSLVNIIAEVFRPNTLTTTTTTALLPTASYSDVCTSYIVAYAGEQGRIDGVVVGVR